ncbi:MAG: DNA internalization-related competence protein ComEC/Rec2, partial [Candidatus Gastranaerophilaceae bacterium]
VFGDDAVNPTQEMKNDFQNSGLTHIIAASGMNVTIIFGMWFFISQILRINYKLSIIIGMISVICYICMTGFGPPVMRAALMLLLVLFGKLIDRKSDTISLLFIVAFILLLFSPTMITDIGFQLSFIVTFGLICFCPLIFDKINSKVINTILSFVIVPVIAQIFASPVQMFYFNSFSPYSVFANIAVVPTLSVVSFGGFASSILALIKPISEFCVKFFDFVLYPFLRFITAVANFFANLPNSSITVPSPSVLQLILYYSILVSILLFFIFETNNRKKTMIIVTMIFLTLLSVVSFIPKYGRDTEIIFFDVGNADCALIKTNKNKFILIDTGKAPYKNFTTSAERIILKYFEDTGIKNLDMMILSHYDADHSGGAGVIMDNVGIKNLVVRSKDTSSSISKYILHKADEQGINVIVPKNGEVIYSDDDAQISAFFIDEGDDNETSIVNLLKLKDKQVLFTGDAGDSSLMKLKRYLPANIDVLKVPHHGAKKTLSEELLNIIKPKVSVISTGFNVYGHPAKETVSLLEISSDYTLRTDKDNAVKVVFHKNEILVYSYNGHRKIFERIKND